MALVSATAARPRARSAAALLLALAALPLLPSLFSPFFGDDYLHIERLQGLSWGRLGAALRSWILRAEDMSAWWTQQGLAIPYFRPLVTLSFLLDHSLWGLRPFGYHLTNLVLHLLTTLLCLGIARRLLRPAWSAWGAAALFAIHPCHSEALAWISGRTDALATLFYSAAVLCHLRGRQERRPTLRALSVLCFLLALCAKEMAVTLPLLLALYEALSPTREPLRRRLVGLVPHCLLGAVFIALRAALLGGRVPPHPFVHGPGDPDFFAHLLTALPLYLGALTLFVPTEPMVTYPFWRGHPVLFGLLSALALLSLRDHLRKSGDRGAARLGMGWMLVTLLPVLPVTVGERFLYLPSMGYCLLIGSTLPEALRRGPRAVLAVAALVLAIAVGKGAVFTALSHRSRQVLDDAIAAMDRAPGARQVLLIDLPAASALAVGHAIRLERPGTAVEVITIAPHFLSPDPAFRSTVRPLDPPEEGLLIEAQGPPYLGTYIEQAYLAERPPPRTGEAVSRPGYQVRVALAEGGRLRALALRLPREQAANRLVLRGEGLRLFAIGPLGTPPEARR